MSEKCWLYDGCKSRTAACVVSQPTNDGCPVYRWFKWLIHEQEREDDKIASIGTCVICPDCGKIAGFNSYFGSYVCGHCGWMEKRNGYDTRREKEADN